jgi:hypothetical protein
MADRTSAEVFATIFCHLAENPDERNTAMANWLWDLSKRYDFHPCQMDCPEELEKLGLVRRRILSTGDVEYYYKGKKGFDDVS